MRTGSNPQKVEKKIVLKTNHRVVVVVFIPELTGFYKNSLEVFKLCVNSLIAANHGAYVITLVNNGSCREVEEMIAGYSKEEIDCVIHHSNNIGKIDAVIGGARGAREDLITLTDADMLFMENWNCATQEVFNAFGKAGSVSPIPFRHGLFYGTSSVFKEVILGRLKFSYKAIPENFDDQNKYLSSINWNIERNTEVKWPVIEKNGVQAIIGSGHQVLTIKRNILFSTVPNAPCLTLVGGDSELKYVDEPIDKSGLMRLGTFHNYAFHMGNNLESWMKNKNIENRVISNAKINKVSDCRKINHDFSTILHKIYILKKHILKRLFKILYRI